MLRIFDIWYQSMLKAKLCNYAKGNHETNVFNLQQCSLNIKVSQMLVEIIIRIISANQVCSSKMTY